jgi:diaminohydroxyphosphoribosylaminopyrimidine deaminase/5-amino-6-(5-phosphoribosylamino)uracil reductase
VRDLGIAGANPVRVVVSSTLALPRTGNLARGGAPLWLFHGPRAEVGDREAWARLSAELFEVPARPDGGLELAAMMQRLGERGITRVLCEGGGRLAAALLRADLVDEVVCYSAGLALGEEGRAGVGPLGVAALALAPRFRLLDAARVGPDVRSRWRR